MPITTQVTWQDLQQSLDTELQELRDAHQEIRELAIEEYDEDALDRVLPNDPDLLDEDERDLYVYQSQLEQYEQTAGMAESRQNLLGFLQDELGSSPFELKLLSGEETMEIEMELRMYAQQDDDIDMESVQIKRNQLTVDAATVDAPEGVPRVVETDEDGDEYETPAPSKVPNGLTRALWDKVERFNSAGDTDFRPVGFSGGTTGETTGLSGVPSTTDSPSKPSDPIGEKRE